MIIRDGEWKCTVRIPRGWRHLDSGRLRKGDKFYIPMYKAWKDVDATRPRKEYLCVIRRAKP
jgi:hypothetical protein